MAISNGAACTSQSYTCSHVLSAMRLPAWRKDGALRFSWCAASTEPDWSALVAAVEPYRSVERVESRVSAPRDETRLLPAVAVHDASAASIAATRRRTTGCSRSRPGVWRVGLTKFATRMLGDIVEFEFSVAPGADDRGRATKSARSKG